MVTVTVLPETEWDCVRTKDQDRTTWTRTMSADVGTNGVMVTWGVQMESRN